MDAISNGLAMKPPWTIFVSLPSRFISEEVQDSWAMKFLRDDAQKSFSKLRLHWGLYWWRASNASTAEEQLLLREAEFAAKQTYALCPFSRKLYKLVNMLVLRAALMSPPRYLTA